MASLKFVSREGSSEKEAEAGSEKDGGITYTNCPGRTLQILTPSRKTKIFGENPVMLVHILPLAESVNLADSQPKS